MSSAHIIVRTRLHAPPTLGPALRYQDVVPRLQFKLRSSPLSDRVHRSVHLVNIPSVRASPPFGPLVQHPLCQSESTVRSTCSTSPLSDQVHRSVHLFNIPSVRASPPFGPLGQHPLCQTKSTVRSTWSTSPLSDRVHRSVHLFNSQLSRSEHLFDVELPPSERK